MIRKNKAITCIMLVMLFMSVIPKGFGAVSNVYAVELAPSVEVAAEPDAFSGYTVEFTYNNLQYVLNGGESVPLSEILSAVGLVGEATEVTVSNSELFSASKKDDKWIITAHKAFNSEEWMRVTINGAVYEITVTDNQEAASGACGNGLTWTLENETLTISKTGEGNGKMTDWGNIYDVPWKENENDIYNVVIGDGVTSVGEYAFYQFSKLTSVTISSTVESIGVAAFQECTGLTSVDIAASSNLTSIGRAAFFGCTSLQSIEIPSGVTSIGRAAFNSCTNLKFAVLKGTIDVARSGEYVFGNCDNTLLVYYQGENYEQVKSTFSIQNMTNTFTISYSQELSHEYDGSAYSPMPTVYYGQALEEGKDYTLSYQKNIDDVWENVENAADVKDVGIYRVVAKGVEGTYYDGMTTYGTYDGGSFSISPRSVTITAASAEKTYDGTALINDNVAVTGGSLATGDTLVAKAAGSATNVSDTGAENNPVKTGYKIMHGTVDVTGNYAITTVAGTLTVNKASGLTVSLADAGYTYDGKSKSITNEPKTNAPAGKTTYSYSFDKDGEYVSDLSSLTKQDAGSYTVYVKATNDNYSNTATTTATLTISKASNPLTVTPAASVKAGGNKVDLSANVSKAEGTVTYTITGALDGCSINANTGVLTSGAKTGTCTVTVTATGNKNYNSGKATIAVNITKNDPTPTPDPNKTDISGATVTLSKKSFTYKDKAQKPTVKSVTLGKKTLTADKDYTVSYSNKSSKNVGTYKVTVSGIRKYTGSVSTTYKIKQASNPMKVSLKKKELNVKLKKLEKKDRTINRSTYLTVSKAQGDVTYTKTSGNSKITVNSKNGKIKISKKLKKGTYNIKVSVKAEGNDNYKASTAKKVKFRIVVK